MPKAKADPKPKSPPVTWDYMCIRHSERGFEIALQSHQPGGSDYYRHSSVKSPAAAKAEILAFFKDLGKPAA